MIARRVNPLLADALAYARRGWPVHPLRGKRPIIHGWPEVATTDESQVRELWTDHPEANVGIIGGPRSELLILDLDNKGSKRGDDTLRTLEAELGPLPDTRVAQTPHGRHFYFAHPNGRIPNSVGALGPGIDIRAEGGYVVAPRSVVNGNRYQWLAECEPIDFPIEWLARLSRQGLDAARPKIPQGARNDTVFREACRLRGRNVSEEAAWDQLRHFNELVCRPPLDERELRRCFEQAWKYPAGHLPNDLGNAERFVERYGRDVQYVIELRCFLLWDGSFWRQDTDALRAIALMKESNRAIWDEARDSSDETRQRKLAQFAIASQNTARLRAAVESVKSEPGVSITVHELNADPLLLGVHNGVVDLRDGTWRQANQADLITMAAGCEYKE